MLVGLVDRSLGGTMNVAEWLRTLGLGQYEAVFHENSVTVDLLPNLTPEDLKDLGVTLVGHRRRMLDAISELRADAGLAEDSRAATAEHPRPPQQSGAERRQLSVMFCDLIGSTPLSSRLDPEELSAVIRGYQARVAAIIPRFGGYIARYVGDGVLIYFGWPEAHEVNAERAVRAALAVTDAIAQAPVLSEPLQVRIGIATGLVVVGAPIYSDEGPQQTAIGETPNLAARLQGLAGPNGIVIDAATRRQIGGFFKFRDLGSIALKGFPNPVPAWEVLEEAAVESRFEALHLPRLTPLVGRLGELALLRERFERALAGEGQAVLLSGEAGIGKSRLVQALCEELSQREDHGMSTTCVRMQCSPSHTASTLHSVLWYVGHAAGFRSDDTPEVRRTKLAAFLARSADDPMDALTALAPFFGLDDREPAVTMDILLEDHATSLSPEQREARAIDILVRELLGLAASGPMLFILEDAQWIDPATRKLITQVLGRIADARVLVLVTHRPEFQCDGMRYPHVTPLTVSRLSQGQSAELAREAASAALSGEILRRIVHRAEGIPLFIEELTRSVIENAGQGSPVPETLQSSLLARLDRLGSEIKEIAQLAAVIGREFEAVLLSAVAGKPTEELVVAMSHLVEAQILLPAAARQGTYHFCHALIQDAAYQSLLLSRRRLLHEKIARTIENEFPKFAEEQPAILAQHYADAAASKQAIAYWVKAGEQALSRFAFREPGAHFERALQLARTLQEGPEQANDILRLLLLLADAQFRILDPEALATFREAAELARIRGSPEELARAALGIEESELWTDMPVGESITWLEAALFALGDSDSPTRCRVLSHLGRALFKLGALERGSATLREATNLARRLDDRRALFDALHCEHIATAGQPWSKAQFALRRGILDEMVRTAEDIHDRPGLTGSAASFALYGYLEIGDLASSRATLAHMREIADANQLTGSSRYAMTSAHAMHAILHGDFVAAEQFAQDAMACATDIHAEVASGVYGVQMFTIRRELGRLAEVGPLLCQFIDENSEVTAWRPGFALMATDLGFEQVARKAFNDLAAGGLAFPRDGKRSITLCYLAEVCVRLRDSDRAPRLYELLSPYRDLALVVPVATACFGAVGRYLGMLATLLGDWSSAEDHFRNALQLDEHLQAWPWLAHTKYEFAQGLSARGGPGDRGRAETLLAEANAIAERLGMTRLESNIRKFVNQGGNPYAAFFDRAELRTAVRDHQGRGKWNKAD
jgi:class 3 adenylate cyclase/tetratricopeptide (TPR) repeat protein/ABC-type transport system involved in cytochrome c biogenesis ATPase subunit